MPCSIVPAGESDGHSGERVPRHVQGQVHAGQDRAWWVHTCTCTHRDKYMRAKIKPGEYIYVHVHTGTSTCGPSSSLVSTYMYMYTQGQVHAGQARAWWVHICTCTHMFADLLISWSIQSSCLKAVSVLFFFARNKSSNQCLHLYRCSVLLANGKRTRHNKLELFMCYTDKRKELCSTETTLYEKYCFAAVKRRIKLGPKTKSRRIS